MSPKKTAAKKTAAQKARRIAKKAQAKALGRTREVLPIADASAPVEAVLRLERRAARVKPRDDRGATTPAASVDGDATVVQAWLDVRAFGDDSIADEIADWAANPTG